MRLRSRVNRLDMVAVTHHDTFALQDYLRLQKHGIRTTREGLRWHLIETKPGRYDFTSALAQLRAAQKTNSRVIWDLFHYGYPDFINILKPEFVASFAAFARAFASFLKDETDDVPFIAPVNEPSFFCWIAGKVGHFAPYKKRRSNDIKLQLARATIEATENFWSISPHARVCHIDPIINIVAQPGRPQDAQAAEGYRLSQYEVWDMISGRLHPEIGGRERYLDIIGVNYYENNQWLHNGKVLRLGDELHRPISEMLAEVYARYRRPMFVAETGTENEARPAWLRYIAEQTHLAKTRGADVHGICLYPIVNFPGWDDDRHCHNGLWDYPDKRGARAIHQPLADELERQQRIFALAENLQQGEKFTHGSTEDLTEEAAA